MLNRTFLSVVCTLITIPFLFGTSGCSQSDDSSDKPCMILIPAGRYRMGNASGRAAPDQGPAHQVYLDAYYIDKHEVTFGEYEQFIQDGGYEKKRFWTKEGWEFIQSNEIKGYLTLGQPLAGKTTQKLYNAPNQPVIGISWYEADAYCRWAGKRLPTEAEWEKAARGEKGFLYPWGNEMIFENIPYRITNGRRTVSVGSFPKGASPYGVRDMAGNVWEWCRDWYDGAYYTKSPSQNPQGPKSGTHHVLRGGGWGSTRLQLQSIYRYYDLPTYRGFNVGFRCASDAK